VVAILARSVTYALTRLSLTWQLRELS